MKLDDFTKNIKNKNNVILEIINKGVIIYGEERYMVVLKNANWK